MCVCGGDSILMSCTEKIVAIALNKGLGEEGTEGCRARRWKGQIWRRPPTLCGALLLMQI